MSLRVRTLKALEISFSKLLPAGFCWQAAAYVAGAVGLKSTGLSFALATGFGDLLGVATGHYIWQVAKKPIATYCNATFKTNMTIPDLTKEAHIGGWLGSAAFLSGTAWQPTLNALQSMDLGMPACFLGVGAVCGAAFFTGLRVGRRFYPSFLPGVERGTKENLVADIGLSASIGGATGTFVGTDTSFVFNPLQKLFGVHDNTPELVGCLKAGSSTLSGFFTFQTAQNLAAQSSPVPNLSTKIASTSRAKTIEV
eukprot:TRINITY_DN20027_c0_g1_i1.p1 TRINITY_DN20027_c0_g1~~TRINITY_DN20027_c0_g1_i1.p1  ORF type:complete len:254 (-),score=36.47 TRINITY_DN20027_c0_g1_i1:613-1374(-)